jgi:hypothetical protein
MAFSSGSRANASRAELKRLCKLAIGFFDAESRYRRAPILLIEHSEIALRTALVLTSICAECGVSMGRRVCGCHR